MSSNLVVSVIETDSWFYGKMVAMKSLVFKLLRAILDGFFYSTIVLEKGLSFYIDDGPTLLI